MKFAELYSLCENTGGKLIWYVEDADNFPYIVIANSEEEGHKLLAAEMDKVFDYKSHAMGSSPGRVKTPHIVKVWRIGQTVKIVPSIALWFGHHDRIKCYLNDYIELNPFKTPPKLSRIFIVVNDNTELFCISDSLKFISTNTSFDRTGAKDYYLGVADSQLREFILHSGNSKALGAPIIWREEELNYGGEERKDASNMLDTLD